MKICEVVSKSLQSHTQQGIIEHDKDGEENAQQLKCKFQSCSTRCQTVREEFGMTDYMVKKVKSLVIGKGILAIPNPKVPQGRVDHVTLFYKSEEIS